MQQPGAEGAVLRLVVAVSRCRRHRRVMVPAMDPMRRVDAVHARHHDVGKRGVESSGFGDEGCERLFRVDGRQGDIADASSSIRALVLCGRETAMKPATSARLGHRTGAVILRAPEHVGRGRTVLRGCRAPDRDTLLPSEVLRTVEGTEGDARRPAGAARDPGHRGGEDRGPPRAGQPPQDRHLHGAGHHLPAITWDEGPAPTGVAKAAGTGFGSRLLRQTVERSLGGRFDRSINADGLRFEMVVGPG